MIYKLSTYKKQKLESMIETKRILTAAHIKAIQTKAAAVTIKSNHIKTNT